MFSKYSFLTVNLVFVPSRYLECEFLSDCAFSSPLPACTFLSSDHKPGSRNHHGLEF